MTFKLSLKSFAPRERWSPSQWAEHCRVLSEFESSEPGPYKFDRSPYWRGVLDAVASRTVEEIVVVKGAQVGYSEAIRNLVGYWVDIDPGPCLIVLPDQNSAEQYRDERLGPLVDHTPAVRAHINPTKPRDLKKHSLKFDTMSVYIAWAGSSQGLKSRPIRYLVCEEPDEYPPTSGGGGDPLSKAMKRITTYADKGRARVLIGGTPTTRIGNVWKRWEACSDRRHYWVPCPHCDKFQRLRWEQVKWPKRDGITHYQQAAVIDREQSAFYECEGCKAAILDHHKPRMLLAGRWGTEDSPDAPTLSRRVGFHISSLYSVWVSFSRLASEWYQVQGDPQALCDWVNQRLGEPAEEQREKVTPSYIRDKAAASPVRRLVPRWAQWLIATADTQGTNERDGHWWYVLRAWARGYRSQLIDYGVTYSKAELLALLDTPVPLEKEGSVLPQMMLVDSGGPRWGEIYELAQNDRRVIPSKGLPKPIQWMVKKSPQKTHNVVLWDIDTEQAKDTLHRLIYDPDKGRWLPNSDIDDTYCRQMSSEVKVYDPAEERERWIKHDRENHLWDCEAMQVAVAWEFGAGAMPEPVVVQKPEVRDDTNYATAHKGRW